MKVLMFFLLSLILSCSKIAPPTEPSIKSDKVNVMLLVAPWCKPCKQELSDAETLLKQYDRTRLLVTAYTETGPQAGSNPTEQSANEMKNSSGAKFPVIPDSSQWFLYKLYFTEGSGILPAAVVMTPTSRWSFEQPYQIKEILQFANGQLK